MAEELRLLLAHIVRELADSPDEVSVTVQPNEQGVRFTVTVADVDVGKALGKGGRIAQAIRTVIHAAGRKYDMKASLEIVGDKANRR